MQEGRFTTASYPSCLYKIICELAWSSWSCVLLFISICIWVQMWGSLSKPGKIKWFPTNYCEGNTKQCLSPLWHPYHAPYLNAALEWPLLNGHMGFWPFIWFCEQSFKSLLSPLRHVAQTDHMTRHLKLIRCITMRYYIPALSLTIRALEGRASCPFWMAIAKTQP